MSIFPLRRRSDHTVVLLRSVVPPRCGFFGRYGQNTIGIDEEGHFNLGNPAGNAGDLGIGVEFSKFAVIFNQVPFSLEKRWMRIPGCPSTWVVYCRRSLQGFVFLGMSTSINPPAVLNARLRGRNVQQQHIARVSRQDIRSYSCTECKTTSSGSSESFTGLPKSRYRFPDQRHPLWLPPTITTGINVGRCQSGIFSDCRHDFIVLSTNGPINNCSSSCHSLSMSPLRFASWHPRMTISLAFRYQAKD